MSDEWPADPTDPRCPECGEPVSATAAYCMHCEVDLPGADGGTADAATGVEVDEAADFDDATTTGTSADDAPTTGTSADDATPGTPSPRAEADHGREDHEGALVDPDSLLDNVSTVVVGAVAGLVAGVLAGLVAFWLLPQGFGGVAFWLGVAVLAGGGLWFARSRTVFDAARRAGYTVGGLLALVPPSVALALEWQSPSGAVGGTVVFGIFVWPVALVVVGLGWLLGKGGVDDD